MELALSETNDRGFNWKVLLENYSENYHTPFVHPEIDTSSSEDYPMVSDGITLYAWDRPLRPSESRVDEIRSTLLPGEPGWSELASTPMNGPYGIGGYLTVWPNWRRVESSGSSDSFLPRTTRGSASVNTPSARPRPARSTASRSTPCSHGT